MWRANKLCTLADEDLGTLAEYDPLTWTAGKEWSEGKGWNTSGKGWEQRRPAGMNNLERDSKQYDVLVMEMPTQERTDTLPPHLPRHRSHEVEVCRRKEISRARKPWCQSPTTVQMSIEGYLDALAM